MDYCTRQYFSTSNNNKKRDDSTEFNTNNLFYFCKFQHLLTTTMKLKVKKYFRVQADSWQD